MTFMATLLSLIGPLEVVGTDLGISRIDFGSRKNITSKPNPQERRCMEELVQYFENRRRRFSVPIEITGTPFQRKVFKAMQTIPFGETRTYSEIAEAIGKPTAVRAVGNACGRNPMPILIPCHRVIGSNGIGGYSGGTSKKKWLLKHEKSSL
jgi:methylated-DNA-[protein]-cysteine S-methyltransferase